MEDIFLLFWVEMDGKGIWGEMKEGDQGTKG